jgi:hypothetical protein
LLKYVKFDREAVEFILMLWIDRFNLIAILNGSDKNLLTTGQTEWIEVKSDIRGWLASWLNFGYMYL